MKRKIFSKLLMVALVIAAVGSFVSCKDYDDDINNLRDQVNKAALQSSVDALKSELDGKIATAQSAAQAAQTAADKAAATANAAVTKAQLDDAISAAKTAAATAANEYADKVATAAQTAAAKEAYDQAKEYVDAEVAKVTAAIPSEDAIKAIADASAAALDEALATELKAWVNEQIDAIDVQGAVDAAVAEAISKMETATANVNAIWSAVTSVELLVGANGATVPGGVAGGNLQFLTGVQIDNVFGSATKGGNAAMPYGAAEEEVTYVKGDSIKFDNRVIVRVSPVNATFTAEDVLLQNSLGETLNDLVDITVKPYKQLITRSGAETGLWEINFIRKPSAKNDDFVAPTHGPKLTWQQDVSGEAAFAIAINNSKDAAETRYAVSEYGLDVYYGYYVASPSFYFEVKDQTAALKDINTLKNRWNPTNKAKWNGTSQNRLIGEDETREAPKAGKWNAELAWKDLDSRQLAADYNLDKDTLTASGKANYEWGTVANKEGRYDQPNYVQLTAANRKFTIQNLRGTDFLLNPNAANQANKIQYYYVVLDRFAAVESAPSEYESWASYSISGLNTIVPATNSLTIEVESEEAIGDIIGFRVFAVNYDGTLADPDGRAFYVKVGDPNEVTSATATVTFTAVNNNGNIDFTGGTITPAIVKNEAVNGKLSGNYNLGIAAFDPAAAGLDLSIPMNASAGAFTIATDAGNPYHPVTTTAVSGEWALLDKDYKQTTTTKNIKYIAVAVKNVGNFGDGATATVSQTDKIEGTDVAHHNIETNKITLKITKTFPTQAVNFAWKSTYEPVSGVKYFYPVPTTVIANQWATKENLTTAWADWQTDPGVGTADPAGTSLYTSMVNFATGITTNYAWKFWKNSNKKATEALSDIAYKQATPYSLEVPASRIGTNTKTVYGEYGLVYAQISSPADEYGRYANPLQNYTINAFAGNVVFEDVISKFTYALKDYTYYTAAKVGTDPQPSKTSTKLAIRYGGAALCPYNLGYDAGAATKVNYGAVTYTKLSDILKGTNSVVSTMNGDFDLTNYNATATIIGTVYNASGVSDLLWASINNTTGVITWGTKVGSSTPLTEVEETVEFKIPDIFGNEQTIKFPIIILPAALDPGFME